MADFFVVGEQYENRLGAYEVVEVRTPDLVIRYTQTGRLQTVEQGLQERIVRNLLRERELALREESEEPTRSQRHTTRRKRANFDGFGEADFLGQIKGTSWRSKTSLGGVLADGMTDRAPGDVFDSWAPNRQTGVYLCLLADCGSEHLDDRPQFFVLTDTDGLTYGLWVQRPTEAEEGGNVWDQLVAALREDSDLADRLMTLLQSGDVQLAWYGDTQGEDEREVVRADDSGLVIERANVTENESLDGLLERLSEAPRNQTLVLTLESGMSEEQAIRAGAHVAGTFVDLFTQLLPLYKACYPTETPEPAQSA